MTPSAAAPSTTELPAAMVAVRMSRRVSISPFCVPTAGVPPAPPSVPGASTKAPGPGSGRSKGGTPARVGRAGAFGTAGTPLYAAPEPLAGAIRLFLEEAGAAASVAAALPLPEAGGGSNYCRAGRGTIGPDSRCSLRCTAVRDLGSGGMLEGRNAWRGPGGGDELAAGAGPD